ncbi:MAG: spermidine synthase [Actinomycetota bacterium]
MADPTRPRFEELDSSDTPLGVISLRRRIEPTLQVDVYEAKLGDDFLMSSLFTHAEVAMADISLAGLAGTELDVVVGGLGLGYTARAVVREPRVRSLRVIETLGEVIGWHRRGLLPVSDDLTSDRRCTFVQGDFFDMVATGAGFGTDAARSRHDAILVDIDHTPRHLLHPGHAAFYGLDQQRRLAERLNPGGVYALWSDDPPDEDYAGVLEEIFASCHAHVITFANPLTGGEASNTVYIARVGD